MDAEGLCVVKQDPFGATYCFRFALQNRDTKCGGAIESWGTVCGSGLWKVFCQKWEVELGRLVLCRQSYFHRCLSYKWTVVELEGGQLMAVSGHCLPRLPEMGHIVGCCNELLQKRCKSW